MNIVHVYRSMGQGGAQKVILQLCKAQREEGHNVWVISAGGYYVEDLENMGVTHIGIPDIASKKPQDIISCIKIIRRICKMIKEGVVHSHHRSAAFDAQLACKGLRGIKLIYTSHNVFSGKKQLLRIALHNTTVIAVGKDVKENLTEYYGLPEGQVEVICNSVERSEEVNSTPLFHREAEVLYVGFVGRLTEVKGVDILIKALAEIGEQNKNIYLYIIGDGDKADVYKNLVTSLNLKTVFFTGYRKDATNLIGQFDVLVLPSWQEGFPLTIIEAFAQGKAVIASNIPGNNELVHSEENGILFKAGDSHELAGIILYLYNNPMKLKELGNSALDNYNKNYSYERFIEKYREAYRSSGVSI